MRGPPRRGKHERKAPRSERTEAASGVGPPRRGKCERNPVLAERAEAASSAGNGSDFSQKSTLSRSQRGPRLEAPRGVNEQPEEGTVGETTRNDHPGGPPGEALGKGESRRAIPYDTEPRGGIGFLQRLGLLFFSESCSATAHH